MVEFKLVLSNPKTGKSYQKIIKDQDTKKFIGMRIADKIKGEMIDLPGYEFEISGGSDYAGFPMRYDLAGIGRKKIWAVSGIGIHNNEKGRRVRKTVCGNTIHPKIAQINLKVIKEGKGPLGEDKPKEEKKEETKK